MPFGKGKLGARLQVKKSLFFFTNLDFLDEIYLQNQPKPTKVDRPHLHTLSQESRDIDQPVDLKRFSARIGKWNEKTIHKLGGKNLRGRFLPMFVLFGGGGPRGG